MTEQEVNADVKKIDVQVSTYQQELTKDWGCRVCFLYEDREPEIFTRGGYKTEIEAFTHGKKLVEHIFSELPNAEIKEVGKLQLIQ